MIKIFSTLLLTLISTLSFGQIRKKSTLIGGQLSYYKENTDRLQSNNILSKTSSTLLNLSIGKAFKENQVIGIDLGFAPETRLQYFNGFDTISIKDRDYQVGAFYRMYKQLDKDFYLFGQLNAGYANSMTEENNSGNNIRSKTEKKGGTSSLGLGISYRLYKKLYVEVQAQNIVGIQYFKTRVTQQNNPVVISEGSSFGISSNLNGYYNIGSLGFGFRFIF